MARHVPFSVFLLCSTVSFAQTPAHTPQNVGAAKEFRFGESSTLVGEGKSAGAPGVGRGKRYLVEPGARRGFDGSGDAAVARSKGDGTLDAMPKPSPKPIPAEVMPDEFAEEIGAPTEDKSDAIALADVRCFKIRFLGSQYARVYAGPKDAFWSGAFADGKMLHDSNIRGRGDGLADLKFVALTYQDPLPENPRKSALKDGKYCVVEKRKNRFHFEFMSEDKCILGFYPSNFDKKLTMGALRKQIGSDFEITEVLTE